MKNYQRNRPRNILIELSLPLRGIGVGDIRRQHLFDDAVHLRIELRRGLLLNAEIGFDNVHPIVGEIQLDRALDLNHYFIKKFPL